MQAIRAQFDGKQIIVPEELRGLPPSEVIIVVENGEPSRNDIPLKQQEESFAKIWNNTSDEVYDKL